MSITLYKRNLGDLRRGDRIIEVDGRPMDPPHVVRLRQPTPGGPLGLTNLISDLTEWNLYPDQVETRVVIEKLHRQQTRTIDGVKLVHTMEQGGDRGMGAWVTEDRRYVIAEHSSPTECEGPHPVRTGRGRGYMCPGFAMHNDWFWGVWDTATNDWLGRTPNFSETFTEAAEDLARHIREEER